MKRIQKFIFNILQVWSEARLAYTKRLANHQLGS